MSAPILLTDLPAFVKDSDEVNIVIETPRGSRNKYAYDPDGGVIRLKSHLPEGQSFPYDFGFIPSTQGGDGDPLDVLVLLDESVMAGCVLNGRLIGVIEAEQTEHGKTERNDRLLAVASISINYGHVHTLEDLRPHLLDEVEHFFRSYNEQRGKQFKPLARRGPDAARELIQRSRR